MHSPLFDVVWSVKQYGLTSKVDRITALDFTYVCCLISFDRVEKNGTVCAVILLLKGRTISNRTDVYGVQRVPSADGSLIMGCIDAVDSKVDSCLAFFFLQIIGLLEVDNYSPIISLICSNQAQT
jgi:hypothetical protein